MRTKSGGMNWMSASWLLLVFCTATALAAPPRSGFVQVNGVKLHYLDWGGQGDTLLFLSDIGYSAYMFGDIAPEFTDRFHVLALTWRGHGKSDRSGSGYDSDTLMEDVRLFLDQKGSRRIVLVGHGIAGKTITLLAALLPDRVAKLVYLDSAYDSSDTELVLKRYNEVLEALPPPPFPTHDNAAYDALRAWGQKRFGCWSPAMEDELHDVVRLQPNGRVENVLSPEAEAAIWRDSMLRQHDFARVKAPALAIYAMDSVETVFPWLTSNTPPPLRAKASAFVEYGNRQKREQAEHFRQSGPNRRIVELANTAHHCFIQRPNEVVKEMRTFLLPTKGQ
jgi:pimeloyl-ACP methyl ester carboxylesterase